MKRLIPTLALSLGVSLLTGSALAQDIQEIVEVVFNVTSDDHPSEVRKRYAAFHRIIEEEVNSRLTDKQVKILLAIAPSYELSIEQMVSGEAHFGRLTPVVYIAAKQQNPDVELLAAAIYKDEEGDDHGHGVLVVHNDSPIQSLADLKGKSIAFISPYATVGHHAKGHLLEAGELKAADFSNFDYLGRNDKVVEAVANGEFDAGTVTLRVFEHEVEQGVPIRMLAKYPVPYNPWVATTTLPADVRDALKAVLLEMEDPAMLEAGGIDDFIPVEDSEYDDTRHAMEHGADYIPSN